MPFFFIISGSVLLIAAVRNTQEELFFLLAHDMTGPQNFVFWFVSILIIGLVGYIPKLKPISDGFLILVILTLFLKKGVGFFDMFNKQIGTTTTTTPQINLAEMSGATAGATAGAGFPTSSIIYNVTNVVGGGGGGDPFVFDFSDPYSEEALRRRSVR
jgi:hypothetical protein